MKREARPLRLSFRDPVVISSAARNLETTATRISQARRAFDQFLSAAQTTIAKFEDQNRVARAGAQDVTGKIMTFAEQNVANAFAYAQRLVHARDPQDLLKLHSEYVQSQMRALGEQAQAVGEAAGKAASEAAQKNQSPSRG